LIVLNDIHQDDGFDLDASSNKGLSIIEFYMNTVMKNSEYIKDFNDICSSNNQVNIIAYEPSKELNGLLEFTSKNIN